MTVEQPDELWAVHVLGMDEYHPCASRYLAIRNATWLNVALVPSYDQYKDRLWPFVYNVPVIYPGSPSEHGAALTIENRDDARWSDPDADILGSLFRHMCKANP